jgi:hypothetical protein
VTAAAFAGAVAILLILALLALFVWVAGRQLRALDGIGAELRARPVARPEPAPPALMSTDDRDLPPLRGGLEAWGEGDDEQAPRGPRWISSR